MITPFRLRAFLPVALLATGACFATRSDVRILQGDLLTMRQEAARADSARARQISQVLSALTVVGDSLEHTGARLATYQGENRGEFRAIVQQMLQLQELVGQSQAVVNRMRAESEARAQQQVQIVPAPVAMTDSTNPISTTPTVANPGPNQLYQDALAQARRGSYGTAQAAFEELLRLYPSFDLAADAMYYLAEAYDADGKADKADSTFLSVVSQHPKATRAPTSLYKVGLSLARRGKRPEARAMMDRVVREYPRTDAAELAAEWLRTNR